MTTSVIQELENEDTTFIKRWGETKHSIEETKDWVRSIHTLIHEARSTEGSVSFTNDLSTDFFVNIETTKKAISDKRFEEMLSNPPMGWILMGIVKSRKEGTIKAQYIKEDDYPVSETELINERYREMVKGTLSIITTHIEQKNSAVEKCIANFASCRGSRLESEVEKMKNNRSQIDCLTTIQELFEKVGQDDDTGAERESFASRFAWEYSKIFACVTECPSLTRYVWREVGIFDPNSDLSQLIGWRKGDKLVGNHISSYSF
jgi:hypothetical protein